MTHAVHQLLPWCCRGHVFLLSYLSISFEVNQEYINEYCVPCKLPWPNTWLHFHIFICSRATFIWPDQAHFHRNKNLSYSQISSISSFVLSSIMFSNVTFQLIRSFFYTIQLVQRTLSISQTLAGEHFYYFHRFYHLRR